MEEAGRSHFAVEVEDLSHRISTLRETITSLHQTFLLRETERQQRSLAVSNSELVISEIETAVLARSDSAMSLSPQVCLDEIAMLRSQLLKLGKAECQLRSRGPEDVTSSTALVAVKEDDGMVRTLQVWQSVFQETLAQYNRLSALLASQQASELALTVWESHLDQVTEGLASPASDSYLAIAEQMRVVALHRSLLLQSHQQLVTRQPAQPSDLLQRLSKRSKEVLDQLDERDSLLRSRQAMWDNFSLDQDKFHAWLREMEREKQLLNLKHVALTRLQIVLGKIQQLLDKIPTGEKLLAQLSAEQRDLKSHFSPASLAPVLTELHSYKERLSSVRAGLLTWAHHLARLDQLAAQERDVHTEVSQHMTEASNLTETEIPTDRGEAASQLVRCQVRSSVL